MFRINKGIHVDFAHVVSGHTGLCLGIHGHTWFFEVGLEANVLDKEGFVIDFKKLKKQVLEPVHKMLDHGFAIGAEDYEVLAPSLTVIGNRLLETRERKHGVAEADECQARNVAGTHGIDLIGSKITYLGSIKCITFDFAPTSERLAAWLYDLASSKLNDGRVHVAYAKVAETIAPVESAAIFYAPVSTIEKIQHLAP